MDSKNKINKLENNRKFSIDKTNIVCFVFFLIIIALCLTRALTFSAEFHPTNGTYQNYNPVRRMYAGQTPCSDFSVYLGFGHLILGTLVTTLFGGTYTDSVNAFAFLTYLLFPLFGLLLGRAILCSKTKVYTVTALSTIAASLPNFIITIFDQTKGIFLQFLNTINSNLVVGNSARIIRGSAPFFAITILIIGARLVNKITIYKNLPDKKKSQLKLIGISIIGGLSFIYSNDYGISTWICLGVMLTWFIFCRSKNILRCIFTLIEYLAISTGSALLGAFIITRGQLQSWIEQTFSIGEFQSWYFISPKSYYIYELDFSPLIVAQSILTCIYLFLIFNKKGNRESLVRYGIPALLNMTGVAAANEYKILSGDILHQISTIILFFTALFEIMNLSANRFKTKKFKSPNKRRSITLAISLVLCIVSITSNIIFVVNEYSSMQDPNTAKYFDKLDGYLTDRAEDLTQANKFLNGSKIWATYATAIETNANQLHPSKNDYIIHALGEKGQAEYLEQFKNSNFDYAATIKNGFFSYGEWIKKSNWYFTKELFTNYHPVFSNTYETFWEKNTDDNNYVISGNNLTLKTEVIDESTVKVILSGDSDINGIAELKCSYNVEKDTSNIKSIFNHLRYLNVQDTHHIKLYSQNTYNLPSSGENAELPVSIINGYGEVTLTSNPNESTTLDVSAISCGEIYSVEFSYLNVLNIKPHSDNNKCIIDVENSPELKFIDKNIKEILVNNKPVKIDRISELYFGEVSYLVDCNKEEIEQTLGKNKYISIN